jgi:prevent-host-death family protein
MTPEQEYVMNGSAPFMQMMKISDVKARLSSLVDEVYHRETRILIEKSGIPVAALVSANDLRRLERLGEEREQRRAALETFGAAFQDVPLDELEREIARIVSEGPVPDEAVSMRQPA